MAQLPAASQLRPGEREPRFAHPPIAGITMPAWAALLVGTHVPGLAGRRLALASPFGGAGLRGAVGRLRDLGDA